MIAVPVSVVVVVVVALCRDMLCLRGGVVSSVCVCVCVPYFVLHAVCSAMLVCWRVCLYVFGLDIFPPGSRDK